MYFQPVLTSNFWKAEGRLELEPAFLQSKTTSDMKLALPYLTRLLNGESSHQSNKWGWALFIFGGANYKQGVH